MIQKSSLESQITDCRDNRAFRGEGGFGFSFNDSGNYSKRLIQHHKNM